DELRQRRRWYHRSTPNRARYGCGGLTDSRDRDRQPAHPPAPARQEIEPITAALAASASTNRIASSAIAKASSFPKVTISGNDGTRTVKPPSSSGSRTTVNFRVQSTKISLQSF